MTALGANEDTLLVLSGMGIPRYSTRGASQLILPRRGAAQIETSINGVSVDLSDPAFQKYETRITCSDQRPFTIDGRWPGRQVIIDCLLEFCYRVGESPSRPVVDDSVRTESGFVFYRPRITFLITNFELEFDEWNATYDWELEAVEK